MRERTQSTFDLIVRFLIDDDSEIAASVARGLRRTNSTMKVETIR